MPLDLTKLEGVQRGNGKIVAGCPVCRANGLDRSQEHLVVYPDGRFGCTVERTSEHRKAIYALVGLHGTGDLPSVSAPEPEPEIQLQRTWPADVLARLVKDHSYWAGRGISEATVAPFQGGVAVAGQLKNRYTFPIFNEDGEIIGFDGRWALPTPPPPPPGKTKGAPWKILGDSRLFVWGGLDEIADSGRAVLVESIGDSLMLREHGVPESLCLFGVNMSETVLAKLIELNPREIIVSTNRDSGLLPNGQPKRVGQQAAIRIKQTLGMFFGEGVARIMHTPAVEGVKDWADCGAEEIHTAFNAPPEAAEPEDDLPAEDASLDTEE